MRPQVARELRWGIISTGWIATKFVTDILIDPKTRDVHVVVHKVVAVGSRTTEKAQGFIDSVAGGDKTIEAFGSYDEVYKHGGVDVIYIGTPHTYHYTNALDAIRSGKHVLCEKPVTCNAAELRSLLSEAKKHAVFFMEAMWTRFQPLALEVKKIIESGELGRPVVVHADFSLQFYLDTLSKEHRLLNPLLGGGALLDLGPYPLVWAIMSIYEHPENDQRPPTSILASMIKTTSTGVDENTAFILTFSNPAATPPFAAQAILTTSMNLVDASPPGASIRCEHGTIEIDQRLPIPNGYTVKYHSKHAVDPKDSQSRDSVKEDLRKEFKYEGTGWHFQADEVARCIWAGKLESELWGHAKSLLAMEIFDEVRRQGGYVFPEGVEKVH